MTQISDRDWVEYSLSNMHLIGFVQDGGDGIYEFNSLERLIEGRMSLMVSETDIRVLPLEMYKEDIESMIDLALQSGDKEWFNELNGKLKEIAMSFPNKEVELKELEMKYVGKLIEYLTYQGELRVANVEEIEFHQGIGKWTFIGVSPFGHPVRLSEDEILRFL